MERTLAVLFGEGGAKLRSEIESIISQRGFTILAEAEVCSEELEEAGLDLGLGTGEASVPLAPYDDAQHVALVLERKAAVSLWKEMIGEGGAAINHSSLSALYPGLKVHGSPSASAAAMSIATLFPNLGTTFSPSSTTSSPAKDVPASRTKPPAFPFALSNLAHSVPAQTAVISPTVERALRKLEEEEKQRTGSSGESLESDPDERRDFTYHSRENTTEFGTEGDAENGYRQAAFEGDELDDEQELLAHEQGHQFATRPQVGSQRSSSTTSSFRAQPLPLSHAAPTIAPRLTKAAALRLGITLPPRPTRVREGSAATDDSTSTTASAPPAPRVVPLPKSLAAPTIVPRATKASLLRNPEEGGSAVNKTPTLASRPRQSLSTAERSAHPSFDNTPGHKRRESLPVASTARPKVEPRLSKTAMLRAGLSIPPTPSSQASRRQSLPATLNPATLNSRTSGTTKPAPARTNGLEDLAEDEEVGSGPKIKTSESARPANRRESSVRLTKAAALRLGLDFEPPKRERDPSAERNTFEGVAGHKRRESIQVASTAKPKVEPRLSKAAMLRAGIEVESPAVRRAAAAPVDFEGVPGHRRRESIPVASSRPPTITPRLNKASMMRNGVDVASPSVPRSVSVLARTSSSSLAPPTPPARSASAQDILKSPSTPRPPSITPRGNKATALRQAQKEAKDAEQNKSLKTGVAKVKRPASMQNLPTFSIFSISALSELTPNGGVSPRNSVMVGGDK